jgi:hypothetical protein
VQVNHTTNQQALSSTVGELLPDGMMVTKGPSLYLDKNEVHIRVEGGDSESLEAMRRAYEAMTGYRLVIEHPAVVPQETAAVAEVAPSSNSGQKMEINAAYAHIKQSLNTPHLMRTSLKQGDIVLTFISPQVGERYLDAMRRLSSETGYRLSIHPHPNQQQILQIVQQLIRSAGWRIQKGPGIHTDRSEVTVTLAERPDEDEYRQINAQFEEKTGYRLVVN